MVVAYLPERLLLTSEVCGSNPVKGETYTEIYFLFNVEKMKITKEEWHMFSYLSSVIIIAYMI